MSKDKKLKDGNCKFLVEQEKLDRFDTTRIKVKMRNKSALFRAFIDDFNNNPEFYSLRLSQIYQELLQN